MQVKTHYCSMQIIGARETQQDAYWVVKDDNDPEAIMALVADGMGGHAGGEVASSLAINEFIKGIGEAVGSWANEFLPALDSANRAIGKAAKNDAALEGMGTTLIAAEIRNNQLRWISVGDSLLLLLRNGEISRLNDDHSLAPQLDAAAARGEMTKKEAEESSSRHVLRSALTGDQLKLVDCPKNGFDLHDGDCLIVASDGIDVLNRQEIEAVFNKHKAATAFEICERLLDSIDVKQNPNQDNTTICVLKID